MELLKEKLIDCMDKLGYIKNKWVKKIPNNLIKFKNYNRKAYFIPVADIVLDNELNQKLIKKRNTVIKFVPLINNTLFNEKTEWVYIFLINDGIVKIGGTRVGLKGRISSYMCGHHVLERGKSGDCSKTNAFIYNTFDYYLNQGYKIKMLGYKLPKTETQVDIFGKKIKVIAQTYHAYESTFLQDYKKNYNSYPILSDNCDPDYK